MNLLKRRQKKASLPQPSISQEDYEALFTEDESLSSLHQEAFSQGNHKRSFEGDQWFYIGESEEEYTLYHDTIVGETATHVLVHIYEENRRLTSMPIGLSKEKYASIYPVQELFPFPMTEKEATHLLRNYFASQKERSTTIETETPPE